MESGFAESMLREVQQYYDCHDMERAGACMETWLRRAAEAGCWEEELTIRNELIGFYRKTGNVENGTVVILRAEALLSEHQLEQEEAAGTTWLNIATAYRAFGRAQLSYNYFMKAKNNYLLRLDPFDYRMASLHNNLALLFLDTGYYEKAEEEFRHAVEILRTDEASEAELVTTYMSMLVLYQRIDLPEYARELCSRELLEEIMNRMTKYEVLPDSYYAYVCDTCAKTLRALHYPKEAGCLEELARRFYQTHAGGADREKQGGK